MPAFVLPSQNSLKGEKQGIVSKMYDKQMSQSLAVQKIKAETYNRLPEAWEEKTGRDSLRN